MDDNVSDVSGWVALVIAIVLMTVGGISTLLLVIGCMWRTAMGNWPFSPKWTQAFVYGGILGLAVGIALYKSL